MGSVRLSKFALKHPRGWRDVSHELVGRGEQLLDDTLGPRRSTLPVRQHVTAAAPPSLQVRYRLATGLTEAATGNRSLLQSLAKEFHSIGQAAANQPELRQAAEQQRLLITEDFMRGPCRNTNLPPAETPEDEDYHAAARSAVADYFFTCQVGRAFMGIAGDLQRGRVNLGADAALVGTDGSLGQMAFYEPKERAARFVNLVSTSRSARLETMLAQGPKSAEERRRLTESAFAYASSHGCSSVIFVNVATDQVLPFGAAVAQAAAAHPTVPGHYVEIGDWPDGAVPTAEGRAPLAAQVDPLIEQVKAAGPRPLLVVNCHMGLDRSAIVNGLVQLAIDHADTTDRRAARKDVLESLKAGRPRAITALRRYRLFCALDQDLRAAQPPGRTATR